MDHIARAYAVMPFVWSIGTIIGPGKSLLKFQFERQEF